MLATAAPLPSTLGACNLIQAVDSAANWSLKRLTVQRHQSSSSTFAFSLNFSQWLPSRKWSSPHWSLSPSLQASAKVVGDGKARMVAQHLTSKVVFTAEYFFHTAPAPKWDWPGEAQHVRLQYFEGELCFSAIFDPAILAQPQSGLGCLGKLCVLVGFIFGLKYICILVYLCICIFVYGWARLGKLNACWAALEEHLYVSTHQSLRLNLPKIQDIWRKGKTTKTTITTTQDKEQHYTVRFTDIFMQSKEGWSKWLKYYGGPIWVKLSKNLIDINHANININNNKKKQRTAQSWARLSKMKSASLTMKQHSQVVQ